MHKGSKMWHLHNRLQLVTLGHDQTIDIISESLALVVDVIAVPYKVLTSLAATLK